MSKIHFDFLYVLLLPFVTIMRLPAFSFPVPHLFLSVLLPTVWNVSPFYYKILQIHVYAYDIDDMVWLDVCVTLWVMRPNVRV